MQKQFEDGFDNHSLKKLEDDIMWKKTQKRELKNRILMDVEKLESRERINKIPNMFFNIKNLGLIRKITYLSFALIILFGLFVGSAFVSPTMAKIVAKIPFLESSMPDNQNVIQLKEHPNQIAAYLNLVSAYNKGDLNLYLQAISKEVSDKSIKQIKREFNTRDINKHQFGAGLELIYSNKDLSILLSKESHAFNLISAYKLDAFIILIKEKEEWKVLEKIPFKKVGTKDKKNDFDKTNQVIQQIDETYHIRLEK